jgi:flagellar biosynthesis chaperone FliJ
VRLQTFHNKEKDTLCRQLQDAKQGRDAAYANVTALKKKKRDIEKKLRKRDCMVEGSARLWICATYLTPLTTFSRRQEN